MKVPQQSGPKGSLKWIQSLINDYPDIIDQHLLNYFELDANRIEWVSPIKQSNYEEYRDDDFLKVLGLDNYKKMLDKFWPKRGPQWDALGKINSEKGVFLVEAKANIPEIISEVKAKSSISIYKIQNSLSLVRDYLNCKSSLSWESLFYQYANRIAHLYFLRNVCKLNAYLVFIYFVNDYSHISTSEEEWKGALRLQKLLMGLTAHKLQKYISELFIDVKLLDGSISELVHQ